MFLYLSQLKSLQISLDSDPTGWDDAPWPAQQALQPWVQGAVHRRGGRAGGTQLSASCRWLLGPSDSPIG